MNYYKITVLTTDITLVISDDGTSSDIAVTEPQSIEIRCQSFDYACRVANDWATILVRLHGFANAEVVAVRRAK